jgi:hypothetical protein
MLDFTNAVINSIAIHQVGNKSNEGLLNCSNSLSSIPTSDLEKTLVNYFLSGFKTPDLFSFHHDTSLSLNEIFTYAGSVFGDETPNGFLAQSINIATHLFNCSTHPKIKVGDLYVVHFQDCAWKGMAVNAIGIFKTENKDNFFKLYETEDGSFEIIVDNGVNLKKLDKGCLIMESNEGTGYDVLQITDVNDRQYWSDSFLGIKPQKDSFNVTKQFIETYHDFVKNELPKDFEVERSDQISLLNSSKSYFKDAENFQFDDFEEKVIKDKQVSQKFKSYVEESHPTISDVMLDDFEISKPAITTQNKFFKSVIKLDRNFSLYVHGNADMMEKGFDAKTGKHYYKLFFEEEN